MFNFKNWVRIAIANLLIVALLGVLMRYKIGFEFPYFNQKNIQHAHSHFAFAGWISMIIMVLMLHSVREKLSQEISYSFTYVILANLVIAYGMLISFAIEGYGIYSILFSSLSIIVSFWFCFKYFALRLFYNDLPGAKWFKMAIVFNILSSLGTLSLSYMMATKQIGQHSYLAAVYWYLHFQYNGWFFFACVGLFVNYLFSKQIVLTCEGRFFNLFSIACIPAYGLSVLWLNLPDWIYLLIVIAAIIQLLGLYLFFKELIILHVIQKIHLNIIARLLLGCVALALSLKVILQLGSTIPAISKFAFGFRPIVIAYLHLVLLAFTSVFLIVYAYITDIFKKNKLTDIGLFTFVIGIILNEVLLSIQGIFSITYTLVPLANELLFVVAIIMFLSLLLINISFILRPKVE